MCCTDRAIICVVDTFMDRNKEIAWRYDPVDHPAFAELPEI
jgi:hypothetical protein